MIARPSRKSLVRLFGPMLLTALLGCQDEDAGGLQERQDDDASGPQERQEDDASMRGDPGDLDAWKDAAKREVVKGLLTSTAHTHDAKAPAPEVVSFAVRETGGFVQYFTEVPSDARYEALLKGNGPDYEVLLRRVAGTTPGDGDSLHVLYWFIPGAERFFLADFPGSENARLTLYRQDAPGEAPRRIVSKEPAGAPNADCAGFLGCTSSADCDAANASEEVGCSRGFSLRCGPPSCLPKAIACVSECGTSACTLEPGEVLQPSCN